MAEANRRNLRVVAAATTFWFVIILIADFLVYVPQGMAFYLSFDLVMTGALILVWIGQMRRWGHTIHQYVTYSFFAFAILWVAALATFQGQPLTFFIASFLLAASLLLPHLLATITFASAYLVFLLSSYLRFGMVIPDIELAMEVAAMCIAAWSLSRILYHTRVRSMLLHRDLEQLASSQQDEISRQTRELEHANKALAKRLEEREVLLREIHHRVKNNLQVLGSLFFLAERRQPGTQAERVLRSAANRVHSMASVHEYLYETEDLQSVRLARYLAELCPHIVRSLDVEYNISLRVDVADCEVELDKAIDIGLICAESISNAISHAFGTGKDATPESPILEIRLWDSAHDLYLTVRDNGPEQPEYGRGKGLGLTLMETLAGQLGGSLTVTYNNGTRVTCVMPR
jgi:two-component sensor histidine kinase